MRIPAPASIPPGRRPSRIPVTLSPLAFGLLLSCASTAPGPAAPASSAPHGELTELSRVEGPIVLCDHRVPESVCTRHHPELVERFQRAGDWCAPHGVPESQCLICHPDLTFDPLPRLPASADLQWLSRAGEDVPDVGARTVPGKVTVVDFYADWCAACRKVTGHLYQRLAQTPGAFAYRKANVVSWETPLAERYLREVPSLPLIHVYGRDGRLVRALHGAELEALDAALAEAGR
jgi:thiol-disulfide isomerase/thioredoxin